MSKVSNRFHRCGDCEGCTAKPCGLCVFCKDSIHFGGPGLKKQSCVRRRCARLLKVKISKEVAGGRIKGGCGSCDECRADECGICLICMDNVFFQGLLLPGALCYKKKCRNSFVLNLPPVEVPAEDDIEYVPRGVPRPRMPKPKNEWKPRKEYTKTKKEPKLQKRKYERSGIYKRENKLADSENIREKYKKKVKLSKSAELRETPSPSSPTESQPKTHVNVEKQFEKRRAPSSNLSLFDSSRPINAIERAFLSIMNSKAIRQSPTAIPNVCSEPESVSIPLKSEVDDNPPEPAQKQEATVDGLYSLFNTLPRAQLVLEKDLLNPTACDWPPPKVIYPTSVQPVLCQIVENPNPDDVHVQQQNETPLGFIISLDSDQVQEHFSDLGSTIPITAADLKTMHYKVIHASPKQQHRVIRISSPRGTYIAKRTD